MKTELPATATFTPALWLTIISLALCASTRAQTATWTGGGGDGEWNTVLNWDIGVPAEGTNAAIAAGGTVNYNLPMVAGSFNGLTLNGVLNVNTNGFVLGGGGNGIATVSGSTAGLFVNSGGDMSATNGGLTLISSAGGTLSTGGSLTLNGALNLGASGTGNVGFMTNNGGNLIATSTTINPNNNSSSSRLVINGGTNSLGDVTVLRSVAGSGGYSTLGTEGLLIYGGLVNMTSLSVGSQNANSFLTMLFAGGTITNTGDTIIRQANNRGSRFLQTGGLFVSTGANGVRVAVTNASQVDIYSVTGGTNIVEKFTLGDITNSSGTVNFTNAATIVVGSGGIVSNTISTLNVALNNGGKFCAKADWASQVRMILTSGTFTFQAADLDDTPHNITLNGHLTGGGSLNKTGSGILTLNSPGNNSSGVTTISQGTLAIGATGVSSSPTINIAAGAVYDLSAAGTATNLSGGQALGGSGAVNGSMTALSGSTLRPGGLLTAGTLTFSNNLAPSGGTIAFDLSDDPTGTTKTNDFLNILGDLNLSGTNTLNVNALSGTLPASSTYTLIRYGGNLTGGLTNLALAGVAGSLSLDTGTRTISVNVLSSTRGPTNVVWLGGLAANNWDTIASSNWLNVASGARDIFVTGDNVRFDDTGATNPTANIVGSVGPASLVVDTTSNYVFSGTGSIDGSGGLTKTNTGTLTILSVNGYLGATIIGGGTVEAGTLANGNVPSSIGSATGDPANLQFFGTTLRYLGASASTDRGATLNDPSATIEVTNSGATLTLNGVLAGSGPLTKTGPGTLTLTAGNSYTNGTVISNGVLRINAANSVGTGGVTNYGATFRLNTTTTVGNVMHFEGTCTLDLGNTGGNQALDGAWSGDGTVNIVNQQSSTIRTFTMGGNGSGGGSMTNFTGTIDIGTNNGFFRFNDGGGTFNSGNSNLFLDLGTSTATFLERNRGATIYLGALAGGSGTVLTNGTDSSGTTTYVIGGRNVDSTMSGNIGSASGAPIALIKVGTGTLTLAGLNLYYGATTVSNGVLALSGSGTIGNTPTITVVSNAALDVSARTDGALTLNTGQALMGDGAILGSLVAGSGSAVSPGASASVIGRLTITNRLQLQAGSTLDMDLDYYNFLGTGTNDTIEGLASVTYGGALNLTITSIETNSIFKLFSAVSYGGAFDTISPPTPPTAIPGLVWDTSYLTVDGTLRITVPRPVMSSFVLQGNELIVSGTNGLPNATYYVLASTNVTLPLNQWVPVATNQFNFDGTFSFTNSVDPTTPQDFFQLQVP